MLWSLCCLKAKGGFFVRGVVIGGTAGLSGEAPGLSGGAAGLGGGVGGLAGLGGGVAGLTGLTDGRSLPAEGWMIGSGGSWVLSCVGWGLGVPGVEDGDTVGPGEGFASGSLVGAGSKGTMGLGGAGSL